MFEGRVILITGGAKGLGRATALHLAERGAAVLALDPDREAGADLERAAGAAGRGTVRHLALDAAREGDVRAAIAEVEKDGGRLDGLVSNAGIMVRKPVETLSLEDWNRVLAVNLTGAFLCAKHAAPVLRRSGGSIVTLASTRARMSEPDTEAYAATKGGLVALTHALAVSLGPDVRVNCVSPGWIDVSRFQGAGSEAEALRPEDHAQHPAGRVGEPRDVAALVAFLLGPESGFITGAEFVIDGGMTRKMIYA